MSMLTAAEIELALKAALPTDSHKVLPSFAALLASIANGEFSSSQISDETIAAAASLLGALVGRSLNIDQTTLHFGPQNRITITENAPSAAPVNSPIQVGDITNSNTVAIGHGATAITVTLPSAEKKPDILFDLAQDSDTIQRFYR